MKQITLLLGIFLILSISSYAQDFIYLKDGTLIHGFVREANNVNIVYTYSDNTEGEKLSINPDRVMKIVYANGYEKIYSGRSNSSSGSSSTNEKDNYFSLGAGFGRSYGGVGIRAQGRLGKKAGIGFHLGYGYNPVQIGEYDRGGPCWALGVKYFYYKWLYVNIQVGAINYEEHISMDEQFTQSYFGVSLLFGGDFFFNDHIGLNVAIGPTYASGADLVGIERATVRATFDLGFIFKF